MAIPKARTLIVEDDQTIRAFLLEVCRGLGLPVVASERGDEAIARLQAESWDLVLSDIRLPGAGGIDVLRAARQRVPPPQVILMTAFATIDMAVEAMKAGACDFLQKPFTSELVESAIRSAIERIELRKDLAALSREMPSSLMVGDAPPLRKIREIIARVAPGDASVLIHGESGVGKELVARQIHALSSRSSRRLVSVHIPSIPSTLVEAELFGHTRGAFTGATKDRIGLLSLSDGGTLFLDEIGDLDGAVQAKLLRFLQERSFRRIGGNEEIEVDVRVICATHRDLQKEVRDGRFREDLFYRLNVVPIHVPPLRERGEDVVPLVEHFIAKYAARMRSPVKRVSPLVLDAYRSYSWPGNVRELENVVCRALALESGEVLEVAHLDTGGAASGSVGERVARGGFSLPDHLAEVEADAIRHALELESGVKSRAAERLGIKRTTLIEKMQKLGITSRKDEER
jgi:two-component system response regulator PilR (NtrC family)